MTSESSEKNCFLNDKSNFGHEGPKTVSSAFSLDLTWNPKNKRITEHFTSIFLLQILG